MKYAVTSYTDTSYNASSKHTFSAFRTKLLKSARKTAILTQICLSQIFHSYDFHKE